MDITDAEPQPLIERMLASAKRDQQTVTSDGRSVRKLIDGVSIHDIRTQMDERGTLFEAWDPRWGWHAEPMVSAHCFTIRPGVVKGWVLHQTYDDRTLVLLGDMKLVLFDPRPGSATLGQVDEIFLCSERRQIVRTPQNVWHAAQNIGTGDLMVLDMPTRLYDYAAPDKHRLQLDTPLIPYSFGDAPGW